MYRLLFLLLAFFAYNLLAQAPRYASYPSFVNQESNLAWPVVDSSPPDTFTTAPVLAFTAPDTIEITVYPNEIDSSDWKDCYFDVSAIQYDPAGIIEPPTSNPWYVPKATLLADSDSVVVVKTVYSQIAPIVAGDPVTRLYHVPVDTVDTLIVSVGVRDSSNNIAYNASVRIAMAINSENVPDGTVTSSGTQSATVTAKPSWYSLTNSWADTSVNTIFLNYCVFKLSKGNDTLGLSDVELVSAVAGKVVNYLSPLPTDTIGTITITGSVSNGDSLRLGAHLQGFTETIDNRFTLWYSPIGLTGDTIIAQDFEGTFNYVLNFILP